MHVPEESLSLESQGIQFPSPRQSLHQLTVTEPSENGIGNVLDWRSNTDSQRDSRLSTLHYYPDRIFNDNLVSLQYLDHKK